MKKIFTLKKLSLIILSIILILSLSACKKNNNNVGGNEGGGSKPSQTEQNNDKTESGDNKTENNVESTPDNQQNNDEQPENKPEPPKPEPVKKTAKELIVGKWTTKEDLAPILADEGINVEGPLEITLNTEFTTNGTLIERADSAEIYPILVAGTKQALLDEIAAQNMTQADFEAQVGMTLDEYVEVALASSGLDYDNLFTFIAEYKFVDDVLLVKSDDTPFVETQYTFINDNTLKITTDSEETIYTRVK